MAAPALSFGEMQPSPLGAFNLCHSEALFKCHPSLVNRFFCYSMMLQHLLLIHDDLNKKQEQLSA